MRRFLMSALATLILILGLVIGAPNASAALSADSTSAASHELTPVGAIGSAPKGARSMTVLPYGSIVWKTASCTYGANGYALATVGGHSFPANTVVTASLYAPSGALMNSRVVTVYAGGRFQDSMQFSGTGGAWVQWRIEIGGSGVVVASWLNFMYSPSSCLF